MVGVKGATPHSRSSQRAKSYSLRLAANQKKKGGPQTARQCSAARIFKENPGLEFSKFFSTVHLRQQTTPLSAIYQTILSFSTSCDRLFRACLLFFLNIFPTVAK
ncbi:MAG TPA: hypothetical protein IAC82_06205 [Candidatus Merdivicinus intestinigallinarum]|nr:hypothetical protein [Candidatus Merdivicinus intestinigallinarum]